jgi:SagB-type dehydrogenase family enzyme
MERFRSVTGKEFMEKTKYQYLNPSDQVKELPQPPLAQGVKDTDTVITLPDPKTLDIPYIDLLTAINQRKSMRKYSNEPLTLDELTYLLWTTQGVKQVIPRPATVRTVPSAGSRHCFETYLLVNNVVGLKPGIYRYAAIEHVLVEVDTTTPDLGKKYSDVCYGQPFVGTSAVTFIWAAEAYRTEWRYGERGYRYMHLDAGHICQNLYLAVEAIDSGCCGIAAFFDDQINALLNLDGTDQFVVYVATVGKVDS